MHVHIGITISRYYFPELGKVTIFSMVSSFSVLLKKSVCVCVGGAGMEGFPGGSAGKESACRGWEDLGEWQ